MKAVSLFRKLRSTETFAFAERLSHVILMNGLSHPDVAWDAQSRALRWGSHENALKLQDPRMG